MQRPRLGSGKKGEKQWKYISSKLTKEWVAKEKKEKKSYSFVTKLLVEVLSRKEKGAKIDCKAAQLLGRLAAPKNIAYTERPPKESILEKNEKTQRFKK